MNILGLIVEYNPFHNGHLFHLNESKKKTNSTHTIAVMSGNFLQRGEPAILDKHTRAEMAVRAGVDLVVELPTLYACQSAELFSQGAITTLDSLNCVNSICFGSEVGDIGVLYTIAEILSSEPLEFKTFLKSYLDLGMLFPVARSKALIDYIEKIKHDDNNTGEEAAYFSKYSTFLDDVDDIEKVLNNPNNILGIEYIKRLIKLNSSIQPQTIKRIQSEYNSTDITGNISSATAIRNKLKNICIFDSNNKSTVDSGNSSAIYYNDILDSLIDTMPYTSYKILKDKLKENIPLMYDEMFFNSLKTSVFRDKDKLSDFFEVNEGIENKIYTEAFSANNTYDLVNSVKSKRYTMTKVKRIINNILLGITKDEIKIAKEIDKMPYIRILAFNNKGREIIKEIKNNSNINIINKFSNIEFFLNDPTFKTFIESDIKASNIYNAVYFKRIGNKFKGPYDYYVQPFYLNE
ncbi:nucleotidyltransferase [Metaclostridioides mangenotii]|uniref:nucleotidyltransferase n=1 Tax=Metaclostridioides mangenotii TaxID=1540 RepID=UPI0028E43D2C|nr:nucleotidyltransferase [Clostridioides mangenotii]